VAKSSSGSVTALKTLTRLRQRPQPFLELGPKGLRDPDSGAGGQPGGQRAAAGEGELPDVADVDGRRSMDAHELSGIQRAQKLLERAAAEDSFACEVIVGGPSLVPDFSTSSVHDPAKSLLCANAGAVIAQTTATMSGRISRFMSTSLPACREGQTAFT